MPGRRRYPPDLAARRSPTFTCRNRRTAPRKKPNMSSWRCGLIDAVDAPTRAVVADKTVGLSGRAGGDPRPARRYPAYAGRRRNRRKPRPDAAVRTDLVEVFFAASSEERRLILTNLDVAAGTSAPRRPPAAERSDPPPGKRRAAAQPRRIRPHARARARHRPRTGRAHRARPFRRTDRGRRPALGMTAAVLQRVLLFLNPAIGQSVERVYDLARLYDELTPAAAERMVAIWRQAGAPVAAAARAGALGRRAPRRPLAVDAGALPLGSRPRRAALARQDRRPNSSAKPPRCRRGNCARRDPRPRRSRHRDRSGFRAPGALRYRLPAPAVSPPSTAVKMRSAGLRLVEGGLRRRPIQSGGAVEPVDLDEDRAGLVGAAPAHRREGAFDVAAAQIGRDPDAGFQAHGLSVTRARRRSPFIPAAGRSWRRVRAPADRRSAPVTGRRRSRSNFSIAALVSGS